MKMTVKSPTRVDLAGGTLDLWPLHQFVGGATTVNVAIDIWTQADVEPSDQVEWISKDLNLHLKYQHREAALADQNPQTQLFRSVLGFFKTTKGFKLQTQSQSPVGGGLGGSSSLTISMLKVFAQYFGHHFANVHEIVHVAHNLEAQVLNTPTGTQDYYPAVTGGLNFLKYTSTGIEQQVVDIKNSPLSDHFLLVYTGKSHHSGINNFEVLKAAVQKESATVKALQDLKAIALDMQMALENQNWLALPSLFNAEFDARVRLAPSFSSPEIEQLESITKKAGAEAVKICGAGGGGCILVWTPPKTRDKVIEACQKQNFQVMNASPCPMIENPLHRSF